MTAQRVEIKTIGGQREFECSTAVLLLVKLIRVGITFVGVDADGARVADRGSGAVSVNVVIKFQPGCHQ